MFDLFLRDRVTNEADLTREHTVSVFFSPEAIISPCQAWLLSESQTSPPLSIDPRFSMTIPETYTFAERADGEGGERVLYAWIKTESEQVIQTPLIKSIILGAAPNCSLNVEKLNNNLKVKIVARSETRDSRITGYLLSKTQRTQPAYNDHRFVSVPPTDMLCNEGEKTYVWVRNRYFVSENAQHFETVLQTRVTFPDNIRAGYFLTNAHDLFYYLDIDGLIHPITGDAFEQAHPGEGLYDHDFWYNDEENPVLEGAIGYLVVIGSLNPGQIRPISFRGNPWKD